MRWPGLRLPLLVLAVALLALGVPRAPADEAYVKFRADDNELVVRRAVPIQYTRLEDFAAAIRQSLPASAAAFRVVRGAPPEVQEYVFAVTADGALLVGEQRRTFDFAERTYTFQQGRLDRTYPAVEGMTPWMWLIEVPLSREVEVTLEVRAEGAWPVRNVVVTPRETPREPPRRRGGSRPPRLARSR
ncbi:MAG: hypothetical protein HYR51_07760 [Candidatus Rokubacteria bacterium]|nr:hypothetical protein [Candidatus Rokubacteria bacterium]